MSAKKVKELRALSEKDLKKKLEDLRKELVKLNAQVNTGTAPKNPSLVRNTRRTIAMILYLLRNKELDELKKKQDGGVKSK